MSNHLVEIARYTSNIDAAFVRNRLEDAGIVSRVDGEAMAGWFWHLGAATGGVKLLVKQEDAERAFEILASASETDFNSSNSDDGARSRLMAPMPKLRSCPGS